MSEQDSSAGVASNIPAAEDRPTEVAPPVTTPCQSPPVAPQPLREEEFDPRARLLQLVAELARHRNRRMLAEFLRLRRAI